MDSLVIHYDHKTGAWSEAQMVAGHFLGDDYHNYPVMTIDAEGYLHVAMARVGTVTHTRSTRPYDTESWEYEREVLTADGEALNGSRPFFVSASDGTLYLFFKRRFGHAYSYGYSYLTSNDHGESWSKEQEAIRHTQLREDYTSNIYVQDVHHLPASEGFPERVLLTWGNAGPGPDGKGGYNNSRKDAFFAWLNLEDRNFYAASGENLGKDVDNEDAETFCKVYDSGPVEEDFRAVKSWLSVRATDSGGYVYAINDKKQERIAAAYWDPASPGWQTVVVKPQIPTDTDVRLLEMEKVDGDSFRIYTEAGVTTDLPGVEVYRSDDSGRTWFLETTLTLENHDIGRLVLVENAHPEWRLISHSFRRQNDLVTFGSKVLPIPHIRPEPPQDNPTPAAPGQLLFQDFNHGGFASEDWEERFIKSPTPGRGRWIVDVYDPRVTLRMPSKLGTNFRHLVYTKEGDTWTDYTISCLIENKIGAPAPEADPYYIRISPTGGVIGRYQDNDNFYAFYHKPEYSIFRISKFVDGEETVLTEKEFATRNLTPFTVNATMKGSKLSATVVNAQGDRVDLSAEDADYSSGGVALVAVKSDWAFDDVAVWEAGHGSGTGVFSWSADGEN